MQNLKTRLEIALGSKVQINENTVKTHVKKLDGIDIFNLNKIYTEEGGISLKMLIKRSGTGLTIIFSK